MSTDVKPKQGDDVEESLVFRINNGISHGLNAAARDMKKLHDGMCAGMNAAVKEVKKLRDAAEKIVRNTVARITTRSQASDAVFVRIKVVPPRPVKNVRIKAKYNPADNTPVIKRLN